MSFLLKTDLASIIYLEDIDVITEGDDTKVTDAINTAITEAQSYLDRYDIDTLFAKTAANRDPILLECCKSLACIYLTKACPANQNTEDLRTGAKDARTWLNRVQNGQAKPKGWPLKTDPATESTFFHVSSNPKRGNHF